MVPSFSEKSLLSDIAIKEQKFILYNLSDLLTLNDYL